MGSISVAPWYEGAGAPPSYTAGVRPASLAIPVPRDQQAAGCFGGEVPEQNALSVTHVTPKRQAQPHTVPCGQAAEAPLVAPAGCESIESMTRVLLGSGTSQGGFECRGEVDEKPSRN